jgi:hypothetical protein
MLYIIKACISQGYALRSGSEDISLNGVTKRPETHGVPGDDQLA